MPSARRTVSWRVGAVLLRPPALNGSVSTAVPAPTATVKRCLGRFAVMDPVNVAVVVDGTVVVVVVVVVVVFAGGLDRNWLPAGFQGGARDEPADGFASK